MVGSWALESSRVDVTCRLHGPTIDKKESAWKEAVHRQIHGTHAHVNSIKIDGGKGGREEKMRRARTQQAAGAERGGK